MGVGIRSSVYKGDGVTDRETLEQMTAVQGRQLLSTERRGQ